MTHGAWPGSFWVLVALWWGMMALMMLPLTWPWLSALARLSATSPSGSQAIPQRVVPAFVLGYLTVWLGFSVGAAALQMLLLSRGSATPALTTTVLAAAGIYQLTPAKAACLKHCRSPLALILSRWPIRTGGALRLGAEHGIFCVGCCWALMLIGLGAGAAGWAWMAGLTALVAAEKLARPGPRLARWAGVGLLALAVGSAARVWSA